VDVLSIRRQYGADALIYGGFYGYESIYGKGSGSA
jgi:hypothetical protein